MATVKSTAFLLAVILILTLCLLEEVQGHGTSYVSVHNKHGGKYEYKIVHDKHHGHWSGHAHPHGYGGFGEKHHYY